MTNTDAHQLSALVRRAACVYRLQPDEITGPRRDVLAVAARAEVIYLARRHGYSLTFLSQFFDRDHTSIMNAERRHETVIRSFPVPVFSSTRTAT